MRKLDGVQPWFRSDMVNRQILESYSDVRTSNFLQVPSSLLSGLRFSPREHNRRGVPLCFRDWRRASTLWPNRRYQCSSIHHIQTVSRVDCGSRSCGEDWRRRPCAEFGFCRME
ncbi:hypothetical protein BRADI_1g57677v3 [Brachypodium distachyon]|uniref:Uncharacterized protein n=1 Tax=Brachypodium distachyon TaxID=15368 RepID=A0A2K2DS37_BRADI|nr:hypothetical protein BRADI_1g57677v3 [Brachypodium distachyon]